MSEERELEGMKTEMEKLAEFLDDLADTVDADEFAGMLRALANGRTAEHIIDNYGWENDI